MSTEWNTTPAEALAERIVRLQLDLNEALKQSRLWETVASERGTRMDEIQARAEEAEHALGAHKLMVKDERRWRAEAEAERDRYRNALEQACDVAIWMSGSSDFSPEGVAHEGWLKMREQLNGALAVLVAARAALATPDTPPDA